MPLVIAAGPSVTDYDKLHLQNLARMGFTFAVNHTCFDFACDVVVSLDPDMARVEYDRLKQLGKPVITRPWEGLKKLDLDFIWLNDKGFEKPMYSGMVAAKLADCLAVGRPSYVIGMDASMGRYKGHSGDKKMHIYNMCPPVSYKGLGLINTINLSVHSKISCWPKQSKLPRVAKIIVSPVQRVVSVAWLRANAAKVISETLQ